MSVINRMSKKQALAALVKVANLQNKLLQKLAMNEEDDMDSNKELCDWCEKNPVINKGDLCIDCEDEGAGDIHSPHSGDEERAFQGSDFDDEDESPMTHEDEEDSHPSLHDEEDEEDEEDDDF